MRNGNTFYRQINGQWFAKGYNVRTGKTYGKWHGNEPTAIFRALSSILCQH